jgi:hypothetical protein
VAVEARTFLELLYTGDGAVTDPFVAKFIASGAYAWAFLGNNGGVANALTTDPAANVLLAGTFSSVYGPSLSEAARLFRRPPKLRGWGHGTSEQVQWAAARPRVHEPSEGVAHGVGIEDPERREHDHAALDPLVVGSAAS